MKNMWNERFAISDYVYGKEPNEFLKEIFETQNNLFLEPILMLGDGEGRNGVYLAKQKLDVTSLDISENALHKAKKLAKENNVTLKTILADVNEFDFREKSWGSIILIYLHLPKVERFRLYENIKKALKPNGFLLFEVFSVDQLNYNSGGPKDLDLLLDENELRENFCSNSGKSKFEILLLERKNVMLNEGKFHQGEASVVRFISRKIS